MARIQTIISKHPGFDHIQVNNPDPTKPPITIVVEDGKITSMYDPTDPLNMTTRASFSTDPSIVAAINSGDSSLLEFKLGEADNLTGDWAEAYTVRLTSKIHDWDDPKTEALNRPARTVEANSQLQNPLNADQIDDVTDSELEAMIEARRNMGLTDDQLQHVGLSKTVDEFTDPQDDAEKFVQLACDSMIPLSEVLSGYSAGFYMSDLLNAIISLDHKGEVSVVELTQDEDGKIQYGEIVPLQPQVEESPDDGETGTYVADNDADDPESLKDYVDPGSPDEEIIDNSVYSDPDDPANYRHDEHADSPHQRNYTNVSIPLSGLNGSAATDDLPNEDTADTPVLSSEEQTIDDGLQFTDTEDSTVKTDVEEADPTLVSDTSYGVDDLIAQAYGTEDTTDGDVETPGPLNEDESAPEDNPSVETAPTLEESEVVSDTMEDEDHVNEEAEVEPEHSGNEADEEIDDLVGFVGKAKKKLADLKDRKSEVDDEIEDLNGIDIEETEALIASFEKDRKELEDQISELRDRKAKVLQDIMEARRQKADQEERLSHLDEKKSESDHLAAQIKSLESALKN